jgi:hypothetical protein
MKAKRPWSVTWLTIGVLSLTVINTIRAVSAAQGWSRLGELPLSVPPAYLLVSGLVWSLAGLVLMWGLWRGARWAPWATRGATLAFLLYYWMDRLALTSNTLRQVNQTFALGATLLITALIFWILWRPVVKAYFGETHER